MHYNTEGPTGISHFHLLYRFRLENPRENECYYDNVTIEETGVTATPTYCGVTLPPSYESTTNVVNITFKTDHSVSMAGFDLSYAFTNERCGGVLDGQSGTITSPSYPDRYPAGVQCTWILPHRGRAITIKILMLALASSNDIPCSINTDSLAICKGETLDPSQLVNLYCAVADNIPINMTIDSNSAVVWFNSVLGGGGGFRLKFEQTIWGPEPRS